MACAPMHLATLPRFHAATLPRGCAASSFAPLLPPLSREQWGSAESMMNSSQQQ
jgi:hypothetical protein